MTTNEQLKDLFEKYLEENAKFEEKGIMVSASRARKALAEIAKLAKIRRVEILEKKKKREEEK